jgi:uncharacterized protein YdeI (YjbR/CyaY-like superfamily)
VATVSPDIITCKSAKEWARWLAAHHKTSNGVWLRCFRKGADVQSITYPEALDEALCYGWIDGQVKKYDVDSFLRKFTPRRKRSIWSKINVGHATRLIDAGRMKPSGRKEIEDAKRDGRWMDAYDSPSRSTLPQDLVEALSKNKKARAFFETLNKANRYAITWRLQTARTPETRQRRLTAILAMLARREAFHP